MAIPKVDIHSLGVGLRMLVELALQHAYLSAPSDHVAEGVQSAVIWYRLPSKQHETPLAFFRKAQRLLAQYSDHFTSALS